MQIRRDLKDHGVLISPETLKECFIMGLGPDFTDIQKDLQWDRLHPEWTPLDIVELIEPARKVLQITSNLRTNNQTYKLLHSINRETTNPTPNTKPHQNNNTPSSPTNDTNSFKQRRARKNQIREDIQNGTFNPDNYKSQVPPDACVFHGWLHKNQPNSTKYCNIVNDLLQQAAQNKPTPDNTTTNSTSHNTPLAVTAKTTQGPTEQDIETINDALDNLTDFGHNVNNVADNDSKATTNIYSTDFNHHFHITCKHASLSNSPPQRITVIDTGAYPHMFTDK